MQNLTELFAVVHEKVNNLLMLCLMKEHRQQNGLITMKHWLNSLNVTSPAAGPATIQDFVWWSGLTVKDAKAGIATLDHNFIHEHDYIFPPTNPISNNKLQTTFLMPDYDEYGISYKNRNAIFNPSNIKGERPDGNTVFNHMIVIDGLIGGTWQKTINKNGVTVQTHPYKTLSKAKYKALVNAEKKYLVFVNTD